MQDECAAAEPRGLRLDQIENQLDGNCGVRRAAPGAQDLQAGLGRQRVGGGSHVGLCDGKIIASPPGCSLRHTAAVLGHSRHAAKRCKREGSERRNYARQGGGPRLRGHTWVSWGWSGPAVLRDFTV